MTEQERELDMMVAELEQENRLLRARNERLEAEQAQKQEPLDTPLPCDVKVGHVTMRKGVALSTLVARMQVLYDMAQEQAQKQEPLCTAAMLDEWFLAKSGMSPETKLYTSPPQRQWVDLTDREMMDAINIDDTPMEMGRKIEAKLKEKNNV